MNHVSFTIEKGEFIAIVGSSESGKSTLLHLIGGVDKPTSGEVIVNGQNVYKKNENELAIFRRREVGLIYQFYNLIPILTVEENMTLPVLLDNQKVNQERLDELLRIFNLKSRGSSPRTFRRTATTCINRKSIDECTIIGIADEPTRNVDSKNSKEIIDLLKLTQKRYKQTLIMITHDERIAMQADRIIVIEDGKIKKDEVCKKMKITNTLTLRYLKANKKRSLLTLLCIMVSVIMMVSVWD